MGVTRGQGEEDSIMGEEKLREQRGLVGGGIIYILKVLIINTTVVVERVTVAALMVTSEGGDCKDDSQYRWQVM